MPSQRSTTGEQHRGFYLFYRASIAAIIALMCFLSTAASLFSTSAIVQVVPSPIAMVTPLGPTIEDPSTDQSDSTTSSVWKTDKVAPRNADTGMASFIQHLSNPLGVAMIEQLGAKQGDNSLNIDRTKLCARQMQLSDNPQALNQAVANIKQSITRVDLKTGVNWYNRIVTSDGNSNNGCTTTSVQPVKENLGPYLSLSLKNGDSIALGYNEGMGPVVGMYEADQAKIDPALKKKLDEAAAAKQAASKGQEVVKTATDLKGKVSYVYGANNANNLTFDCSSFMQYVFGKSGIKLPRTSAAQASVGKQVAVKDARPGDLVVYNSSDSPSGGHAALYIGNGEVISNTSSASDVKVTKLNYMPVRSIRRVVPDAPAVVTTEAPKEAPKPVVETPVQTVANTAKATATAPTVKALPTKLIIPGLSPKQLKDWENVADCESDFRWTVVANHGKYGTHYGGLQFNPATWNTFKKGISTAPTADKATVEEQILVAEATLKGQGWKAWECAKRFGLSGKSH